VAKSIILSVKNNPKNFSKRETTKILYLWRTIVHLIKKIKKMITENVIDAHMIKKGKIIKQVG